MRMERMQHDNPMETEILQKTSEHDRQERKGFFIGWREVYHHITNNQNKMLTVNNIASAMGISHEKASKFARKCVEHDQNIGKGINDKGCFYIYIDNDH